MKIRWLRETPSGQRVCDRRRDRLVHFMGDRGRQLAHYRAWLACASCSCALPKASWEHSYKEALAIIGENKPVLLALAQALIDHPEPTLNVKAIRCRQRIRARVRVRMPPPRATRNSWRCCGPGADGTKPFMAESSRVNSGVTGWPSSPGESLGKKLH
jgi:hypothetical protein